MVHCVECHLPPEGFPKFSQKVRTGLRDVYGTVFKDVSAINWEEKSQLDHAVHHTFQTSCVDCHKNLFPIGLSQKGQEAHLYFDNNQESLNCLNCHIGVGHFSETTVHAQNINFGEPDKGPDTIFTRAAVVQSFENFTEQIPGTGISFDMVAVPGGQFMMGSPETEAYRDPDEGPLHNVEVSPFFMAKLEVSWDEYLAFFSETGGEGRMSEAELAAKSVDGISGPTPPWGAPDQGWGKGERPAITMSYYAATVYCEWLSQKTGKKYRLPTEAEWEYAARGGTTGPYFFDGDAKKYTSEGFFRKIFGPDTSLINRYAIYKENSRGVTALPSAVLPNPFGLKNMYGKCGGILQRFLPPWLSGFCQYSQQKWKNMLSGAVLIKAMPVTCAVPPVIIPGPTAWLKTDPQMPKSKWWYSDQIQVGFRVVCEPDSAMIK